MSIPRRPEDFFDQVHQLGAATPIEALARAVGVESRATDAPVAAVAQLRPRQGVSGPGIQVPDPRPGRSLRGESNESLDDIDTDPGVEAAASAAGAVPEAHIDLFLDALEEVEEAPDAPVFLTTSVVCEPSPVDEAWVADPFGGPDPGLAAGLTPIDSVLDLPEEAFERVPPPAAPDLDYSDVDALLSSVSGRVNSPVRTAPAAATYAAPPAPRVMTTREAPSERAAASTHPSVGVAVPAAPPQAFTPTSGAGAPPRIAASPTAPTLAVPPVTGPTPNAGTSSTLASVAAVNRDLGPRPRRWSRETIRTRAVGPLQFEPLAPQDIDAFEMDCGGMGGEFLKQVRRAVGVSIEDIATRTKISQGMLRYIEAEELKFLPARVYLRGYLTQIGRLLKLPVPKVVDGFMRANGLGKK
jgi:hypothetical protein